MGSPPVVELGRFTRLSDARERGLVLAACGVTHAIGRDGDDWFLQIARQDLSRAVSELAAYEAELAGREAPVEEVFPAVPHWSLAIVAVIVIGFAVTQAEMGDIWRAAGVLSSPLVCERGEWWRTVTALTLHADVPHVVANLCAGLLFGGLLITSFGQGLAWLSVVLAGALGNALTAWAYFPEPHCSLGASTAVFGALGLLVGDALGRLVQRRTGRSWWCWMLPLGAGVSLLAFLGAGEGKGNVDVLAHLWGFVVGGPLGLGIAICKPNPNSRLLQCICGLCVLLILGLAWIVGIKASQL